MPASDLQNQFHHIASDLLSELISIRRHLHQYPELSFEERNTGAYIADRLKDMDIPHTTGWGGYGVVGLLDSGRPGPVLALRADIDALPIREVEGRTYGSRQEGVMHACGHDAHTASLLGAAAILQRMKHHWQGQIKLIFQPGEEKFPGGASLLINEGVLQNPAPEAIYGQHVLPDLAAGKVGFREGMFMASCDELYLCVEGRGGHGAMPHLTVDPVAISALLVTALQQVVSRKANPTQPSVLSFGRIYSDGGATNIIPSRVYLEGTLRTLNESWRREACDLLTAMAHDLCRSMGAQCTVEIRKGFPPLINDPGITQKSRDWAREYLGADQVVDLDIRMGAEDFAYYSQEIPACFYRLGTAHRDGTPYPGLHTPDFDIEESSLSIGGGLMAWIAYRHLNGEN